MAVMIESWVKNDLKRALQVQYLQGMVFSGDNEGNLVGVEVTDNGEPAALAGSVSANVIRADGTTVAVTGTLSGNQASVVLPQAAYAVPGVISIIIKITDSDTDAVTTLAAVVSNVYRSSTDTIVDPGDIIPSVQTLIAAIETAVESIPADYSSLWTTLAPAYSTSSTYAVGQYVTYNGGLYRCTTAITTAESWTSGHWTAAKVGTDLSNLKRDLKNAFDGTLAEYNGTYITAVDNYTQDGLTFNLTENGLQIYGTQTSANRYYDGLNGNKTLKNTNTAFGKIIEPGLYRAYINILQGTPSKAITITVSSTNGSGADSQRLNDGDIFVISQKSGVALRTVASTNFGTSEAPTIVNYGVVRLVPYDEYARETAENAQNYFGFFQPENILFENGSIDTSDGGPTASKTNRLRTTYCKLEDGFKITVPDGWLFGFCLYSSASVAGYLQFSGWKYNNTLDYMEMENGAAYVRFVLKKTDDSDIIPSDASGVSISKFINAENIASYIPDLGIVQGSMNDQGADSSTNYETRLRTGYIPVDPVYGFNMTVPSGLKVNYFLYTGNTASTFFYESGVYTDDYVMHYDGAETAKYVRFWIRKTDDSEIVPSDASGIIGEFFFRGDENTDGYLLNPNGVDQTEEIQRLLDLGRCDLAPGSFYITGVTMPQGAILSGSGSKTKLILSGSSDGNCITMSKYCTVKNLEIVGSTAEIELSGTIGNRHGIYLEGTPPNSTETAWQCMISECFIHGFTGGGITLYKTGFARAAKVIGCYLYNNCVGLYIKENSEYIHVSDCTITKNYYGCINNGGNNLFSCCTFTTNSYGLMMGDTEGTEYGNSGKAEYSGCNFGHNDIRSIYLNNMIMSGIGFAGCYISEKGIEIVGSKAINFSGCSMTDSVELAVTNGGIIMFTGCNFRNEFANKISITNNNKIHFNSCYYYDGTVCNPVS